MRVCLFGAGPDTGNHGVTALGLATVRGILRRRPAAMITVFDHGSAERTEMIEVAGQERPVRLMGAVNSRRVYRSENLWNAMARGCVGGLGSTIVRAVREADVVLDVSGGDSFTDMYGPTRFRSMTLPKLITLQQGTPLVLLPQTIGPFETTAAMERAKWIVWEARFVWSRDAQGIESLREMLGAKFDERRHRAAVDLAFGLEPAEPCDGVCEGVVQWLRSPVEQRVAVNVSGLLFNDAAAARARYGLRTEYREAMRQVVERLVHEAGVRVLLVPHVQTEGGQGESDDAANAALMQVLEPATRRHVGVATSVRGPREAKWLIGQANWFYGARMHATIAALSSGVACAAVAYSGKTAGVFETCGMEDETCDARSCTTEELVTRLWARFQRRGEVAKRLDERMASVRDRAERQMDEIVEQCESLAAARACARAAA